MTRVKHWAILKGASLQFHGWWTKAVKQFEAADAKRKTLRLKMNLATPNDPKLSDGGAWRGACPTVERTADAQM